MCEIGQRPHHFVITRLRRQDARAIVTSLAVVEHTGHRYALQESADIGIFKQDRGRFPAQFESDRAEHFAADPGDLASGGSGTGERHLVDAGMAHKVCPRAAIRRHPVQHASGHARFQCRFGEQIAVQNGARRGFDHQRAARRHGRCNLVEREGDGEVPRHDRSHHAQRRTFDQRFLAHLRRAHIGLAQPLRQFSIILDHARTELPFQHGAERDRHAVLRAHRLGDLGAARGDRSHEAFHHRRAFSRARLRPARFVERLARRRHRSINIRFDRFGNRTDFLFGGGVDQGEAAIARRFDPFIADEKCISARNHFHSSPNGGAICLPNSHP